MGNWTHTDDYTLLPNIYVRSHFEDGVLKHYQLFPCPNYVLHVPSGDCPAFDEEGNELFDENGNPIIEPYYSWGGATEFVGYDIATNPCGYEAILYQEGMQVFGGVKPPTEIM